MRVWLVDPPPAVLPDSVDPSVAERLKALGYAW
jgi:hypothetical protein